MELVQQILNGINTSAFIINREKKVIFVNRELTNLLHQSEQELTGSCFGELVRCKHTVSMKNGCGLSKECKDCAFRKYLDHGIATKETVEGEISIIANVKGIDVPFSARIKISALFWKQNLPKERQRINNIFSILSIIIELFEERE